MDPITLSIFITFFVSFWTQLCNNVDNDNDNDRRRQGRTSTSTSTRYRNVEPY
jgi:hypothetical protein